MKLFLGSQKELEKKVADLRAKLDGMAPDVRKKLAEERRKALKPEELQLLDTSRVLLKPDQIQKRSEVDSKVAITDRDVADRIAHEQPTKANQALQTASELDARKQPLQYTINYKHDANYDYWQNRADFEQTPDALAAREDMYRAKRHSTKPTWCWPSSCTRRVSRNGGR